MICYTSDPIFHDGTKRPPAVPTPRFGMDAFMHLSEMLPMHQRMALHRTRHSYASNNQIPVEQGDSRPRRKFAAMQHAGI